MTDATETVILEDIADDDDDLAMEINNNDVPANNNNNTGMKNNNNNAVGGGSAAYAAGDGSGRSRRPVNIQVTAKVLFGSVSAISALNAERKKKPGSPQ